MKDLLRSRIEIIFGLLAVSIIALERYILGDENIAYIGLSAILFIFLYDLAGFILFNIPPFGPSWLLYTPSKVEVSFRLWPLRRFTTFPFASLNKIERNIGSNSEVYIFTPNLALDTENTAIIDTVAKNLARGVHYVFISSDVPDMMIVFERLRQHHQSANKISAYAAAKEVVESAASDNIMIISDPSKPMQGFLQIPDESKDYWAKMSKDATLKYYENIRNIIGHPDAEGRIVSKFSRLVFGVPVLFLR